MKRFFYTLIIILSAAAVSCGQIIECSPEFPDISSQNVVITFHADKGTAGLKGFSGDVYAHTGVILKDGTDNDWVKVVADWNKNTEKCKMTRTAADTYTLNIGNIKDFYSLTGDEAAKIKRMAFVFRSADGKKEGKNTGGLNIFYDVSSSSGLKLSVKTPAETPYFVNAGEKFLIETSVSKETATITYETDGYEISETGTSVEITAAQTGFHIINITAKDGEETVSTSISYVVRENAETAEMPQGLRRGVNKISDTEATFVLFAPNKKSAYLIGDFTDWQITEKSAMKLSEDKKYFFCTISGLDAGKEYAYQYIVDETIRIADPYTEKILDPDNDKFLTKDVYDQNLTYPENKTFGIVSAFTLNKKDYQWSEFSAPKSKDLIIYEMLLRDFTPEGTVKAAKEKLDYLETLGINAIELMPFSEFEGNDSWGYNPSYNFAADKAYGTPEDYKNFIDECHKRGIAVIQDVVLNHAFGSSPLVKLYFDGKNVTKDSPWFNIESPNKNYQWGYDFNHEAPETQALVDSVMSYWMTQYNIDGIRFDFTKGFTNTPGEGTPYDEPRIKILKRIYDKMQSIKPGSFMICEHLCDNKEETELAACGIMLWGNMNNAFCQSAMGYPSDCNLNSLYYKQRGFSSPLIVGYAESHDEERMMFKCLNYGQTTPKYDVKDLTTALKRMKGATAILLSVPGPKMIWQFGELGYDYSINFDVNSGTENSDARTGRKPYPSDYINVEARKNLYNFYSELCAMRKTNDAMINGETEIQASGLLKVVYRKSTEANLIFAVNFNTETKTAKINFPKSGRWYDITTGEVYEVSEGENQISLTAGQTAIFSDRENDVMTANTDVEGKTMTADIQLYPNPCAGFLNISSDKAIEKISLYTSDGKHVKDYSVNSPSAEISLSGLKTGMYLAAVKTATRYIVKKIIICK